MALKELLVTASRSWLQHEAALAAALTLLAIVIFYLVTNEVIRQRARIPNLLGPPKYREWSKQYGAVYQVQLGNIPVVIVNSAAAAKEILGGSNALASRPEFYTFHKIVSDTSGTTIGTSPYSDSLKRRRKAAASALNRPSVQTYTEHLDVETREFIRELLEYGDDGRTPVDPMPTMQRLALSLALTLNWGVCIDSQKSPLFQEITFVEQSISGFRSTTGNLQDYIPLLRFIPFNAHSAKAREMRTRRSRYITALNAELAARIAAEGTNITPCIQSNVLTSTDTPHLTPAELTSISLTMLSGGLDTLPGQTTWLIALLAQRPDIQARALSEIRRFHDPKEPLCDAEDSGHCAYVVALVRESLRYFSILRLALPKASVRDVMYRGVTIPEGAVVFLNVWACNMDTDLWPDPEVFRPERFLERPDAPMFAYGMGCRMCAGSLLANRELYLTTVRLRSCFRIESVDEGDIDPVRGVADPRSLVAVPGRFRALFVPRDEELWRRAIGEAAAREGERGGLPLTSVGVER